MQARAMRVRSKRRLFQMMVSICATSLLLWLFLYIRQPSVIGGLGVDGITGKRLQVHIVEEHHEVIPLWLGAATTLNMKKGVTLVHIDSHSDMGPPEIVPNYPLFRRPRTLMEASTLMQSNDRHVMAAISSGLISRVVWIFPFWVVNETLYQRNMVAIGTIRHNQRPHFCLCTEKALKANVSRCFIADYNSEEYLFIPESSCPKKLSIEEEHIKDIYALTRLQSDKAWIPRGTPTARPIWLDIDEDFFGVELVGQSLLAAGIPWSQVIALDSALKQLFCPRDIRHEVAGDEWFRGVVAQMRTAGCGRSGGGRKTALCWDDKTAYSKLFEPFHRGPGRPFLCNNHIAAHVDVESRASFLSAWSNLSLSVQQLSALEEVGLCLNTSLRTHGEKPSLGLCLGSNMPGQSSVQEHGVTPEELDQQMDRVEAIMSNLPQPTIITIARSSRDGYVPRSWQQTIEKRLLSLLQKIYKLTPEDLFYDELLFGGRPGWHARLQDSVKNVTSRT